MCSWCGLDPRPAHSAVERDRATAQSLLGRPVASVPHLEPRGRGFQDPWGPVWAPSPLPPCEEACLPSCPPALQQCPEPVPTSPIAETVPHGHSLRTPIAIAPAWAETGESPSIGTLGRADKDPHSQRSPGTAGPISQARAATHPRSPSRVLWISFRTPAGLGGTEAW